MIRDTTLFIAFTPQQTISAFHARNGSLAWQQPLGHLGAGQLIPEMSLAASEESLIVEAADGYLIALRLTDGKVIWENEYFFRQQQGRPEQRGGQQVRVQGEHVIARNALGTLAAFDIRDGQLQWEYAEKAYLLTLGEGRVYVINYDDVARMPAVIHVLALTTGRQQWTIPWELPNGHIGTIQEQDGIAYMRGSKLQARDGQSGRFLWQQIVSILDMQRPFAVGSKYLYLLERQSGGPSEVFAFRRDTGALVWSVSSDKNEVFNNLRIMNNILLVARSVQAGMQIEAWDETQGTIKWTSPDDPSFLKGDFSWRFVTGGGIICTPVPPQSGEGILAMRAADGQTLWRIPLHIGMGADMLIANSQ